MGKNYVSIVYREFHGVLRLVFLNTEKLLELRGEALSTPSWRVLRAHYSAVDRSHDVGYNRWGHLSLITIHNLEHNAFCTHPRISAASNMGATVEDVSRAAVGRYQSD